MRTVLKPQLTGIVTNQSLSLAVSPPNWLIHPARLVDSLHGNHLAAHANWPKFRPPCPTELNVRKMPKAETKTLLVVVPSWCTAHCKEDSKYVFQKIKLRGIDPNFHIHISVSD